MECRSAPGGELGGAPQPGRPFSEGFEILKDLPSSFPKGRGSAVSEALFFWAACNASEAVKLDTVKAKGFSYKPGMAAACALKRDPRFAKLICKGYQTN